MHNELRILLTFISGYISAFRFDSSKSPHINLIIHPLVITTFFVYMILYHFLKKWTKLVLLVKVISNFIDIYYFLTLTLLQKILYIKVNTVFSRFPCHLLFMFFLIVSIVPIFLWPHWVLLMFLLFVLLTVTIYVD